MKFKSITAWSLLDNFSQQFLTFLVFLILARFLTPNEFGVMAIVNLAITFIRQAGFNGISQTLARVDYLSSDLLISAFSFVTLLCFFFSSLMFFSADYISNYYENKDIKYAFLGMIPVVFFFGLSSIFEAVLIKKAEFKLLAIRSLISVIIGGCISILLALNKFGIFALIAQQVITSLIALILLIINSNLGLKFQINFISLLNYKHDIKKVSFSSFFNFLISQGDTLIVSLLLGTFATGIYSFAKRLTSAIYLVIGSSILKIALSSFSSLKNNLNDLRNNYLRLLFLNLLLILPLYCGLNVVSHDFITLFFPSVWYEAEPVLLILSVFYVIYLISQLNDYLFFSLGMHNLPVFRAFSQVALTLSVTCLYLKSNLVTISNLFLVVAAFVYLIFQIKIHRVLNISITTLFKLSFFLIVPNAFLILGVWGIGFYSHGTDFKIFTLKIITGIVFFITSLFLVKTLFKFENDSFLNFFNRNN